MTGSPHVALRAPGNGYLRREHVLPLCDAIPQRTAPLATLTSIAVSALLALAADTHDLTPLALTMLWLWLFGWTVEDRLGRPRFVVLFLACGALAWSVASAADALDGAVAGVLGAYFSLSPRGIMLVLVPVPPLIVEVPAVVLLGVWFLVEVVLGPFLPPLSALAAGAAMSLLLRRPERMRVEWWSP